jgi:hypothetical protein
VFGIGETVRGAKETTADEYLSYIVYHSNSPEWNEVVRLRMSPAQFCGSHLLVYCRHQSSTPGGKKKLFRGHKHSSDAVAPFAFAYFRFTETSGVVIPDKAHKLGCFKYDADRSLKAVGPAWYFEASEVSE